MIILWDVDTQFDFMLPVGKLYVPGAEETVPAMKRLVDAARAAGIVHVASADDHELTDAEISTEPDFVTTYPPHCLRGTRGARKIPETDQEDPVPLALDRRHFIDACGSILTGSSIRLAQKLEVDVVG